MQKSDILMIAGSNPIEFDKRVIQTARSFSESGYTVHLIIPPQSVKITTDLMAYAGKSVIFHELPPIDPKFFYLSLGDLLPISHCWALINRLINRVYLKKRVNRFYWKHVAPKLNKMKLLNLFSFFFQVGPVSFLRYYQVMRLDFFNHWYLITSLHILKQYNVLFSYCHDSSPLAVPVILKDKFGLKICCDCHDIMLSIYEDPICKKIAEKSESWLFRKVDVFYTVNDSLAAYFKTRFAFLDPVVLTNAPICKPLSQTLPDLKNKLGIKKNDILGVFVGTLNHPLRFESFFSIFARFHSRYHLAVVSGGPAVDKLKEIVKDLNIGDRVHFVGGVPFYRLHDMISSADFGLVHCIPKEINGGMNSSSKLYDYIHAALPIFSDYGVEIEKLFKQYKIGTIFDIDSPFEEIMAGFEDFIRKIENGYFTDVAKAKETICWSKTLVEDTVSSLGFK